MKPLAEHFNKTGTLYMPHGNNVNSYGQTRKFKTLDDIIGTKNLLDFMATEIQLINNLPQLIIWYIELPLKILDR